MKLASARMIRIFQRTAVGLPEIVDAEVFIRPA
jgi:hypothetical protein